MSWGIYFQEGPDSPAVVAALFEHKDDADLAFRIASNRPIDSDLLADHMKRYAEMYKVKKPAYLFEPAEGWLELYAAELSHIRELIRDTNGKIEATLRQGELFADVQRRVRP